jgi:hypothetical protein
MAGFTRKPVAQKCKTENTMGTQLSHWVSRKLGIAYHPHLIRKIMPKLYLDADPVVWRSSAACWAIRPTRC